MSIPADAQSACARLGVKPEELLTVFWQGIVDTTRRPGSWEASLAFEFLDAHGFREVTPYGA